VIFHWKRITVNMTKIEVLPPDHSEVAHGPPPALSQAVAAEVGNVCAAGAAGCSGSGGGSEETALQICWRVGHVDLPATQVFR